MAENFSSNVDCGNNILPKSSECKEEINKIFESNMGEYLENKKIIEDYCNLFNTTPEKVKEAITTIFESFFKKKLSELSPDDKIKKNIMITEMEIYFENNNC